jgi:hypothetical protein
VKTERVQVVVSVKLRCDTPKLRREAMRELRETLGCAIYSTGQDGYFAVETGRVTELKREPKP